ncbi:bacteriorhodopsin [Teratosphaeria destructans]|uniref:Bacteriorhodopsin n=1 Tax=Teratosphaeria destructans TaxID=418781 RepID=A0A9W7SL95_9PEZI|nr:bacteriorhodopsin [Teratosphaeria destructans]
MSSSSDYGLLFKRGNNAAVRVNTLSNGKSVDISITERGSDVYYGIMSVMGATAIFILIAAAFKSRSERVFFYMTAAINFTACIAYYAMGSNVGWTPIDVEWRRYNHHGVGGVNREIFYARYIDWFVTTPLLIMDLLLTAGMPWPTIAWAIFMDEVMVVTGLLGALVHSRFKWGFYGFGCAAMFYVFWIIAFEGRKHARRLGRDIHRVYVLCGVLTLVIWLLYPIAWGVSEGGNVITPDSEAVFYGILDLCAKPLFSIFLLVGHWRIDPARMGMRLRDYDQEPDQFGRRDDKDGEKHEAGGPGVMNGTPNEPATGMTTATSHGAANSTAAGNTRGAETTV